MATKITGDSKPEKQKLSIGNIGSSFKKIGANFSQKFSKGPGITFGKGGTGTSSPLTSGTDPSKITDSLNETNRILVEIQNQLAIDFANRIADSKDQLKANKLAVNTQKRTDKENRLETKWLGNALGNAGKAFGKVDNSLGSVLGVKGGLFGTVFKGIGLLFTGVLGLAAWKFFQNPDNIKRLTYLFNNLGSFITKGIDWVKTTWSQFKPKLDMLMSLPFENMAEAKAWIQNAVIEIFPQWIRDMLKVPMESENRGVYIEDGGTAPGKGLLGGGGLWNRKTAGIADFLTFGKWDFDQQGNLFGGKHSKSGFGGEKEFSDGGYTGGGGRVHANEFVMNSDAVNKWGVNLLSAMNDGKDQSLGLGKTPRRTVVENIDLPDIIKPKTINQLNNAPATAVPTYSSINPLNGDMVKGPIHYGFAEFI